MENSERKVWYALQTFHCREQQVEDYLKEQGLKSFIPMLYTERVLPDGKKKRELTPAVHNLLFLQKAWDDDDSFLARLVAG